LASVIKRFVFAKYCARRNILNLIAAPVPCPCLHLVSSPALPSVRLLADPLAPSAFLFPKPQNTAAQGANRSLNLAARAADSAAKYCKLRNEILKLWNLAALFMSAASRSWQALNFKPKDKAKPLFAIILRNHSDLYLHV
jgi:hypothetical protein